MQCNQLHKSLNSYLNKSLGQDATHDFSLHLKECASCAQMVQEIEQTMSLLDKPKRLEVDPFMHTRIIAQLDSQNESKSVRFAQIFQPIVLGAMIMVGVYLGIGLGSQFYAEDSLNKSKAYDIESQLSDLGFALAESDRDVFEQFLSTE